MKAQGVEVKKLGGLHIVGTERHEARRIDLQLARSLRSPRRSRQQSLLPVARRRPDAHLRRRMGEERPHAPRHAGRRSDRQPLVTRRIEGAQKKVEERNFDIRKNLLEYDEVMDEQRKRVYGFRQRILNGEDCANCNVIRSTAKTPLR
jgi:preprotein translocase subunit SecA